MSVGKPTKATLTFGPKRQQKETSDKNRDSFRGFRFVFISGLIAAVLLSFYFSYRWLKISHPDFLNSVQRMVSLQGLRIEKYDLKITGSDEFTLTSSQASAFDSAMKRAQNILNQVKGQNIFTVELGSIRDELIEEGWAQRAAVRRLFPNQIEVTLTPRKPQFLVRGSRQWVVTDKEGFAILVVKEIPGTWASLPSILGLEEMYSYGRNPQELNRRVENIKHIFADLLSLQDVLEKKLELEIESIRVDDDPEGLTPIFKVAASKLTDRRSSSFEIQLRSENWLSRIQGLQYVLSDLASKNLEPKRILGQFQSRFFVSSRPNSLEAVEKLRRM